jgi:hypothetical protein
MPAVSRIDELLAGPASVVRFCELLGELDRLPEPELRTQLARAEAALASWPDDTRCAGDEIVSDELVPGAMFKPSAVLLRKLEFEPSHGGCAPSFVLEIARAHEFAQLTILSLFAEDIDCEGAEAIVNSPTLSELRDLRLGQRIADAGFHAIASSPYLGKLESLQLSGTLGDDDTAKLLADSPHLAKLVHLQWDDDGLGDEGLWALGMARGLRPDIRSEFLSCLDPARLRERARELGVAQEGSDEALVAALARHVEQT